MTAAISKAAAELTHKVAAMTTTERASRAEQIIAIPGAEKDLALVLEFSKCVFGPDAGATASPAEVEDYEAEMKRTHTPEWFRTATCID